ncbi:hypothetical protein OSB04_020358 [Centaurea solstitialis]|uniref:Uncharacterized protein n=1 Tax=Centaurea solstitialis TaxID=347529 RepID=A0AA38SS29_9ASTR|nr:hypothetical protein OSB04_020358 [Centaurea solstitialis]
MDVALSTTLANLTAAVNRLQPSSVNDNRRRRDRFEEPVMVPPNGNHNRVNCLSFESEEEEEDPEEKMDVELQRILLLSKEESQHHNLFRSHCSVDKRVCNLVIDGGSSENLVSRKFVDYFNLPTQPHEAPYSLGWVENGPQVRVTQTCRVPISIGKHYQDEILCNVLDMEACHILLGRSWQYNNCVTYKSRDNVIIFRCGDRKIAMRGLNSFEERPPKKKEVFPEKFEDEVIPDVIKPPQETIPNVIKPPQEVVLVVAEQPQKIVPVVLEPSKPLSEEVKISDYTDPIPGNVSLVYYPYELDEITLTWSRVQPMEVDPFWDFDDPLVRPNDVVYDLLLHLDPEQFKNLHENSRSSSFQVGVSDTDRFRAVSQVILHVILAKWMTTSETFQVAAMIEKLQPSWIDFENYLKHERTKMFVDYLVVPHDAFSVVLTFTVKNEFSFEPFLF